MSFSKDLGYYAFVFLEKIYNILPKNMHNGLKRLFSKLLYALGGRRKRIVLKNIEILTGKKDEKTAKKFYDVFVDNVFEFFENLNLTKDNLAEKVEFENVEMVKESLKDGPVVFVTAHYGNWEIMPVAVGALLGDIDVVVRKLDNEKLNEKIEKSRKRFGVNVYDKRGGLRHLVSSLKKGRSVGILVDQYPGDDKGVITRFCGKPVRHTEVAAVLSKKFNVPVIVSFVEKQNGKYIIKFIEKFFTEDINSSVDRQADIMGKYILENGIHKWYLFHRRFRPWEKYE